MKIVLNILMDERIGGPTLRTLQIAKHLNGYKTIVVMPSGTNVFVEMLSQAGIPYYQINLKRIRRSSNPIGNLAYFFWLLPNIYSLIRIIKKEKIDVVHANGLIHLQGPIAARLTSTKLLWHLNDANVGVPKLLRIPCIFLLKKLASKIAVTSQAVIDYCNSDVTRISGDIPILGVPVDEKRFNPNIDPLMLKTEIGFPKDAKLIGSVGNINENKNYETFIEAAGLLSREYDNLRFVIVGPALGTQPKYFNKLKSYVRRLGLEDILLFTGARQDIPNIMAALDVFVFTSLSESGPMVVLEAMATGKPVVSTKVGLVPDVLKEGQTGFLVPFKDPESVANAVKMLLENPNMAKEFGIKGRQSMLEKFTLKRCAEKYLEVYKSV